MKRRTQSKSALSFPLDLISEILLRLPEKSVARFRCVSKRWLSITTARCFINLFENRSPRPSLLLCFKEDDKLFVSSIHRNSNETSQPIDRYHMNFPKISTFPPTESVHGLICYQESATPIVWNHIMGQFSTLPKPSLSWENLTILLGYDPMEGKHKVVCIPYQTSCDVCQVLTMGSAQESWRTVKTNHNFSSDGHTSGRCIKGVVYYLAYVYHPRVHVVMSFDVRSEKFDIIQLPSEIHRDVFITYEGMLACVESCITNDGKTTWKDGITLWILEDAEQHKWSSKDVLAPFSHQDESLSAYFKLKGFTHAGVFIYVASTYRSVDYILYFDQKRNSFRRFIVKGIADDKSRLRNGVENGRMCALHAFPNHVEGQMSL